MSHWRKISGLALLLGLAAGMLFGGPNAAGAAEEAAKDAAAGASTAAAASVAFTKEMADSLKDMKVGMDTVWVLLTAFLVFS